MNELLYVTQFKIDIIIISKLSILHRCVIYLTKKIKLFNDSFLEIEAQKGGWGASSNFASCQFTLQWQLWTITRIQYVTTQTPQPDKHRFNMFNQWKKVLTNTNRCRKGQHTDPIFKKKLTKCLFPPVGVWVSL